MRYVLLCLALFTGSPALAAPTPGFGTGAIQPVSTAKASPDLASGMPVTLDGARLATDRPGDRAWLPSRSGAALPARVRQVVRRPDGVLAWAAEVRTQAGPQTATLVVKDGHAFGWIPQASGAALRLETRHGKSRLVEAEGGLARPGGADVLFPPEPTPEMRALRERQEASKAAGTPRIDVLVAYQPSLVDAWGSVAAVQSRIAYLETITNQAYVDTGMDLQIRVVATHLVDFPADADNSDALYAITDDSFLPIKYEIDRARILYGADLVKLMRNFDRVNQTSCGIGWLGGYHGNAFVRRYGFSVSADIGYPGDGCGEWTFAHELGHNQGAHHDIETTDGDYGAFEYSRGHRKTLEDNTGFATIMAYTTGPQQRLGRFSDPDLFECLGQACGIAEEADNARGIGETAAMVAGLMTEPATGILPGVSIEDAVVMEGQSGTRPVTFTLRLASVSGAAAFVQYTTVPGSADETDYVPRSGSVQIPAGQTTATITVSVRGDTLTEGDEVFAVNLISATGAHIARGQGVATITSDDPLPTLAIADIELDEGDEGARDAVFTATLSQASNAPVRFDVQANAFGGSTAARRGTDFGTLRIEGLEIPPGALAVQFSVPVYGDTEVEPDESFYIAVGGVEGAELTGAIVRARIRNDDAEGGAPALPELSVQSTSVDEGSAGPRDVPVTVSLSQPSAAEVRFALLAEGVTATAGEDFDASALGDLVIAPGQTSVQAMLRVIGDTLDEADEVLQLRLGNVVGATPSPVAASVLIRDDDGGAATAPFIARDDRFVLTENTGDTRLPVLANDAMAPADLVGATLEISEPAVVGLVQVDTNGTPGTAADDVIVYSPGTDASYADVLAYRTCTASGRCTEGLVEVIVRPAPDAFLASDLGRGYGEFEVPALRPVPGLRLDSRLFAEAPAQDQLLAVDPTPESPWDEAGTHTRLHLLQNWLLGNPGETTGPEDYRVVVDTSMPAGGDVDLYVGVDDNRNGRADPGETRCTSAMGGAIERCEFDVQVPEDSQRQVWVRQHNRGVAAVTARSHYFAIRRHDLPQGSTEWAATGPGQPASGEAFPVRVSWNTPGLDVGSAALGLLALRDWDGALLGEVPVRFDRAGFEAPATFLAYGGDAQAVLVGAGDDTARLYVDVPPGAGSITLDLQSYAPLSVRLLAGQAGAGPQVAPAPGGAAVLFEGVVDGNLVRTLSPPASGRIFIEADNPGASPSWLRARAHGAGGNTAIAPGSYFNPDRSGHGLFLYPAGNQLVGIWYTYLQDGSPTWYYLQGADPGTAKAWEAPIHRAAWNGQQNTLTAVGLASVTVHPDGLVLSYRLDGEVGSEVIEPLGAGCPSLAGATIDASSHWFDPARPGPGYSVQLFPDYEFYTAFVYDERGQPRFLTAEAPNFLGADATLTLEQLAGFCPLCERTGAPARADVGTLRRRFDAGGLVQMQVDAIYGGGVPGAWTGNDLVQPLGGPGTTQGCPAP